MKKKQSPTSSEERAEMVRMIRSGMSLSEVSRRMGVAIQTISRYTGWNPVRSRTYGDPAPALRMETWYRSRVYPDWRITKRIWAEDYGDGMYGWWSDYAVKRIGSKDTKIHNSLIDAARYVKEADNENN